MIERNLTVQFRNKNDTSILVVLEPWAEEFEVPPGSVLAIKITHAREGMLDTEYSPQQITVWLWGGCRAGVFLDGKDQERHSLSIPAPG